MKKYFITGLVILLPFTLTLIVVLFVFNLLTDPFLGAIKAVFTRYDWLDKGILFLSADQVQTLVSKVFILFGLFGFTLLLGAVARWFLFNYLINLWEYVIHRIPFVSTIYRACNDVIKTVFTTKNNAFKQVVMVKFPNEETHTLGLLTRDGIAGLESALGKNLVSVFIPTTPNPTSGFLVVLKKEEIIPLEMHVEDAFKYIISCGVIMPTFDREITHKAVQINE